MKYRILSNGEGYKVQKRVLFWWSTEGYEYVSMSGHDGPGWNPHIFATFEEARDYVIKQCKAERQRKSQGKWTVVKVLTCK